MLSTKILVDIASQQLTVIYLGKILYSFSCITGDAKHPTPTGVYKIIGKYLKCRSGKYNAQMNYALHINKGKICIHESYNSIEDPAKQTRVATFLSDTTASVVSFARKNNPEIAKKNIAVGSINLLGSHGCIRLAHSDAVTLFNWAEIGTVVEIK